MTDTVIAVYDAPTPASQAITALQRAGVPAASIHRHVRDGDDLVSQHPPVVVVEGGTIWDVLFGIDDPVEHLVTEDSEEAGGTVVRVTGIPAEHVEAVLDVLQRYHPVELQAPASRPTTP